MPLTPLAKELKRRCDVALAGGPELSLVFPAELLGPQATAFFDRLDEALTPLSVVCVACGFDSDDIDEAVAHLRTHEAEA